MSIPGEDAADAADKIGSIHGRVRQPRKRLRTVQESGPLARNQDGVTANLDVGLSES